MIYQNQCDIAESSSKEVSSALKRERALLDTQQAEVLMMQMILDGTQRALQDLYPDIVLRQDMLLERIRQQSTRQLQSSHSIPRLIAQPIEPLQRPDVKSVDGISDLGDSMLGSDADGGSSVGGSCHQGHGIPPVFTSVQALQQQSQ